MKSSRLKSILLTVAVVLAAGAGGIALYSARSDAAADKKPGAP